jgi:hypothetical protein
VDRTAGGWRCVSLGITSRWPVQDRSQEGYDFFTVDSERPWRRRSLGHGRPSVARNAQWRRDKGSVQFICVVLLGQDPTG